MAVANAPVDLEKVKGRHFLGDVVEAAGIQLRGRGRVRQGVCPFHDEAEGSFTVYGDTERFHCFGCGATGDVLDFVQRTEGLSLPEAIRRLGGIGPAVERAGPVRTAPTPWPPDTAVLPPRPPDTAVLPPRDTTVLTAAVRFYAGQLRRSPQAHTYLASRGVGPDTARRLGLGYAPGRGLQEYMDSQGFTAKRLMDSAMVSEKGAERFAGMVVVPDITHGRVRWLAGRAMDPYRSPRFQALPGPKPVLGLGRLGPAPRWVVLTEGLFDWLTLTQWGLRACAALGTQGMERVAVALRGCPRVLLAFDSDDAGRAASQRLMDLLGRRAVAVTLPDGVGDVADLATHPQGCALFLRLLVRAAHTTR